MCDFSSARPNERCSSRALFVCDFVATVELIDIAYINEGHERTLKSDVRYRFVIDMATLTQ